MPSSATTILLVDDSRASRLLCAGILHSLQPGLRILEAGDGEAALALLATEEPALVVLDMNMPGISGLEVAARLRAEGRHMALALLTANAQDALRERAARLALPVFRKPVGAAVLGEILRLLP